MSRAGPELDAPEFVRAVQSGDRTVITRVLEICLPSLRRLLSVRFHLAPQECDDVLQEVQVAFLAAAPRFRGECSLHTYLVQITCRKCADYLRARQRDAPFWQQTERQSSGESRDAALDAVADRVAIQTALVYLTARERLLLDLFYNQAKSYKEIAAAMGVAIGSVGAMKAEALLKLRAALGGEGPRAGEVADEARK